jgi:DNA-binding protein YbaB
LDSFSPDDLEKLANLNEQRLSKMQELTTKIASLTGEGYAADDRIKVVVTNNSAISELNLDPRAMRMDSHTLAENIVAAAQAAAEDLQKKIEDAMSAVMDESPFDYLNGSVNMEQKFDEIKSSFQQSLDEVMDRAEKIRRDLLG